MSAKVLKAHRCQLAAGLAAMFLTGALVGYAVGVGGSPLAGYPQIPEGGEVAQAFLGEIGALAAGVIGAVVAMCLFGRAAGVDFDATPRPARR